MKQSVAPESTSALMSAIVLLVLIETGICMDRNRVVTITELNLWTALTQADGFRRVENPLFLQGPSLPVLVRLLLLLLPLKAMNWPVVAGSEYLIARSKAVLRRIYSCRLLLLRVLDWGVESSFVIRWLCSTYAEDNCDSDVPFCDMCITQLREDLLSFLLLVPVACILPVEYTLLRAWLQGSSLRFRRRVPLFVLPMCPWHSGRSTFVGVSTPLDRKWLCRRGVPLV